MRELILRVGKKGEIYTTKEIREKLGIREGGRVIAYIRDNILVIVPLPDIEEKIQRTVIKLTPEEVERMSEEAQREKSVYE